MPTFYFSETPAYDSLDGVEFSNAEEAREAAVNAVKTIAADPANPGPASSKIYVWDPRGVMIFEVSLTVEVKTLTQESPASRS